MPFSTDVSSMLSNSSSAIKDVSEFTFGDSHTQNGISLNHYYNNARNIHTQVHLEAAVVK